MGTTETPAAAGTAQADLSQITSKEAWAAKAVHTIACHSGATIKVRIPDLPALIAADAVPQHLLAVAVRELLEEMIPRELLEKIAAAEGRELPEPAEKSDEERAEAIKKLAELHRYLVSQMLVEPQLTPAELAAGSPLRPPEDDMRMLTAIALRERDTDALGRTLGVAPLGLFAPFRRHHRCDEGCENCQAVRDELSTHRADRV